MDINKIEEVQELRKKLDENFRVGQGFVDNGVAVTINGEVVALPEHLLQSIGDLVQAQLIREGHEIVDQLHDLGVDLSNYGDKGIFGGSDDLQAVFENMFGSAPEEAKFSAPGLRGVQVPLSPEQLSSIVGGDADILSLLADASRAGRRSR